jgi:hypothetical protein
MKVLKSLVLVSTLGLCGCQQSSQPVPLPEGTTFQAYNIASGGSMVYYLIEVKYKGCTYIVLQNYDGNNQSMVKLAEIPER